MQNSENINELANALSKFQAELKQPVLNKTVTVKTQRGDNYKFKYSDFANCKLAAQEILGKHGLCVTQLIEEDCSVMTILMHSSGQYISCRTKMPGAAGSAQSAGSAITYAKRYAFCAILGIVADEDDDANIADGNKFDGKPNKSSDTDLDLAIQQVKEATTKSELKQIYDSWAAYQENPKFLEYLSERKKSL